MTAEHPEIKRSYAAAAQAALPSLAGLPKVAAVELALRSTTEAVYSDTDDLALADAGIVLRRRTGGSDAGWHLRLPLRGDNRSELVKPLKDDDESVPVELTAQLRAWVRDRELRTVATLSTRRVVHRLIDDGGKVLAEITDDLVTVEAGPRNGEPVRTAWREWEIELVHGSPKLLMAAAELFVQAGASTPAWPSKLHHALGRKPHPAVPHQVQPTDRSSAGAVVTGYLAEQIAVILTQDVDVRRCFPDAVQRMRLATRRLRNTLSTYRPLFDRSTTDPIRVELKWLAASLGAVHDVEVVREHLLVALAAEPATPVLGPIGHQIGVDLQSQLAATQIALLTDLDSGRYFRLLDSLDALTAAPPLTDFAGGRARTLLRQRLRHVCGRLHALVTLGPPMIGTDRTGWLQDVGAATARLRYAAEAAEPALGRPAAALAAAAEQLQVALSQYQDGVVARTALQAIGTQIFLDGQNPFTIGRLHALEQTRCEAADGRFTDLWASHIAEHLRNWIGR